MVTWQPFIAQLLPDFLANIAVEVRDALATQGTPLTLPEYLTRVADGMPLIGPPAEELLTQWFGLLTENRDASSTYAQYIAAFATPEQPLAAAFAAALERTGISYGEFQSGDQDVAAATLLQTDSATYWALTHQALQIRGQRFLDQEERLAAFAAATGPAWAPAFTELLEELATEDPYTSLYTVAQLPLNRLALAISPVADTQYLALSLQQLHNLAVEVQAGNYLPEEEVAVFKSKTPYSPDGIQALLSLLDPNPSVAISVLAENSPSALQGMLAESLKPNTPFVYALAQEFQGQIASFLTTYTAQTPIAALPEAFRNVRLQLTGQAGKPLANAGLRLAQQFSNGQLVDLGEARAYSNGEFMVGVRQEYEVGDQDIVTLLPSTLQVEVFAPEKPIGVEPGFIAEYTIPVDELLLLVPTNLPVDTVPLVSQLVSDLITEALPEELEAYATLSLAEIRQMGGLLNQASIPLETETARAVARTIDAHAQFELISTDTAFTTRVIAEGQFFSPAQVIQGNSRDEFVQLLGGTTNDDRLRAATFYEQTVVVDSLLQALTLAKGSIRNSGLDQPQEPPLTQYTPGPDAATLVSSPQDQCDCSACRSAVGPTAYLASLLNYAVTHLRQPAETTAGQYVMAQQLQDQFLQPFCDLPVSCQYAEQSVCRYRLIIEVLRQHLRQDAETSALALQASHVRPYLLDAYEALAQGLGASSIEIAQATNSDAAVPLAKQLRLLPGTLTSLRQKFSSIPDNRPLQEVEADFERYFGLVSTSPGRDPLSTGLLMTQPNPFVRLNLQGIQWAVNTADDGTVTAQVLLEVGKPPKLLIHRNGASSLDEVVATGILVADAAPATTYRTVLYPQHDSGVKGSAIINGPLVAATVSVAVIPLVTKDRLILLEGDWQQQDFDAKSLLFSWQTPALNNSHVRSWNGYKFIIDPDVIGPDDFRPGPNGQPATTGWAYQVWANRFNFLQAQFTNGTLTLNQYIEGLLAGNSSAGDTGYPTIQGPVVHFKPWDPSEWAETPNPYDGMSTIGVIDLVQSDLASSDAEGLKAAQSALQAIGLTREAFDRLNELRSKPNGNLTPEEKEEGRQILRQSLKKAFEQIWATEETNSQDATQNVSLNGNWFQRALQEPIEGQWFTSSEVANLSTPAVDPQVSAPADLPDAGLGDAAATLWSHRAALLQTVQQAIFATGTTLLPADRANAMLEYTYSGDLAQPVTPPLQPPHLPQPPYDTLEELSAVYQDSTHLENGRVIAYVTADLGLTLTELKRLIELREQVRTTPSDNLWQEMAATLTRGWKRAVVYRASAFVMPDGSTEPYWVSPYLGTAGTNPVDIAGRIALVRKQKLVKWRASGAVRTKWVAALDQAFQRPLIDPDQLAPDDFHQAGKRVLVNPDPLQPAPYVNPAFDLYAQRIASLDGATGLYANTVPTWSDNGTRQGITSVLRASQAELELLYQRYLDKGDIAAELKRLNLTPAGLDLVNNGADRQQELHHLLVQVQRERLYADWSREEVKRGLYQSPQYFRQKEQGSQLPNSYPWRTSARERRAWQQTLAARYDQADATVGATQQLVKSVEDQSLSLLRDALVDAVVLLSGSTPPVPLTHAEKREQLGKLYLLDFNLACCQHTTRVGQAIEVLQKLFFNQQHGLSNAPQALSLATLNTTFSQEWQWLGSYEKWRSLMFLYLYPQNILLPALKPNSTARFLNSVRGIRQGIGLRPADACAYVKAYETYLSDLASLQFADAVQTYVEVRKNGCARLTTEKRRISMQASLAGSYTAYTNLHYLTNESPVNPAAAPVWINTDSTVKPAVAPVWNAVPGSLLVQRIIGLASYKNSASERHIYLFVFLQPEKQSAVSQPSNSEIQLGVQRFSLDSLTWDEEYTPLDLAGEGAIEANNVKVSGAMDESWPPVIVGVRNRRRPSVKEYPFTSFDHPTPSGASTDLGELSRHNSYNLDLFAAALNASGKGLSEQVKRNVVFVQSFKIASVIRTAKASVFVMVHAINNSFFLKSFNVNINGPGNQESEILIDPDSLSYFNYLNTFNSADSQAVYAYKADVYLYLQILYSAALPGRWVYTYAQHFLDTFNVGPRPVRVDPPFYPTNTYSTLFTGEVTSASGAKHRVFDLYVSILILSSETVFTDKLTFSLENNSPVPVLAPANLVSPFFQQVAEPSTYIGPIWQTPLSPTASGATTALVRHALIPVTAATTLSTGTSKPQLTITQSSSPARYLYEALPALPPLLTPATSTDLVQRQIELARLFPNDSITSNSLLAHIASEAYLALPLLLATELLKGKYYEEALSYFRLIYDYTRLDGVTTSTQRLIYPDLKNSATNVNAINAWLANPDNPYTVAGLREDSQLQFVVMNVVQCLLGYADSEFSRDTVESVSQARSLYELAIQVLAQDLVPYGVQDCYSILNQVDSLVDAGWQAEWTALKAVIASVNQRTALEQLLHNTVIEGSGGRGLIWLFTQAQNGNGSWSDRFNQAWQLVDSRITSLEGRYESLCSSLRRASGGGNTDPGGLQTNNAMREGLIQAAANQVAQRFVAAVEQIQADSGEATNEWLANKVPVINDPSNAEYPVELQLSLLTNRQRPYVPFLGVAFCVPTNPIPYSLQLRAALNLYKIRTCRNIAGIQRELDAYAAPTDTTTGMFAIGVNGQLSQTGRLVIPATQYRYAYIVERTRQLVVLAQQAESALLAALEKRDAEAYNLLKARQDISLGRANIQLQNLRVNEAEDGIELAQLQLERSELMESQYDEWLSAGIIQFEQDLLDAIRSEKKYTIIQTGFTAISSGFAALAASQYGKEAIAGVSQMAATYAAIAGIGVASARADIQTTQFRASFERRTQEWTFQRNLMGQDIKIGEQQIRLSNDRLRIVGQERRISELQLDHSEAVMNFLTTKFTNAELYDWMSQILESTYSYFLQQATATAKLAELQLAFERQETPVQLIQEDYWTPPSQGSEPTNFNTTAVDRKGLTGSIRLLQDITRLDQYAFETNQRKLQLTKTVSLAQAFPTEFVRFRETGVLAFAFPQTWFDQDFPGHYLRIIRRVRTSVIALVPPVEGIKARLATAGLSRVTVAGTPFQTVTLPRQPEGVALTSPQNATGLFEMEQQPGEFLYPFEGLGVDVPWTFSLQKASNLGLDYGAIADVLVTLEYTALENNDYARQILPLMAPERTQVVSLSLRNRFADQWYDLHHAAELASTDQYKVQLQISPADLPTNLTNLQLKHLALYIDAPLDEEFGEQNRMQFSVSLSRKVGNSSTTPVLARANRYGLISTKTGIGTGPLYTGNAAGWVPLMHNSPVGEWILTAGLATGIDLLRERLDQGLVNDIYLILEVEGDAPVYTLV